MQIKHGPAAMSNRLNALKERCERLGLRQKNLAAQAGLDEMTISRAFQSVTDPLSSTLDKIEAVVIAEEQRMRAHLATIPAPSIQPEAAE